MSGFISFYDEGWDEEEWRGDLISLLVWLLLIHAGLDG